jgi:hypothetical protein
VMGVTGVTSQARNQGHARLAKLSVTTGKYSGCDWAAESSLVLLLTPFCDCHHTVCRLFSA